MRRGVLFITLSSFRIEYHKADGFCQEVQSFANLAGIPALNELRNAGKHCLCALDDNGNVIDTEQMTSAINHARRAAYEAYEAGILFALEYIVKFKNDYATVTVDATVPNYTALLATAKAAQKSIEEGRQHNFDRTADHSKRMDAFRELRACADTLELAREEMNKKFEPARVAANTLRVGIFAIVAAVLLVVWTAFDFWPLHRDQVDQKKEVITVDVGSAGQITSNAQSTVR